MFPYKQEEVHECFCNARNLNAAIKHVIRSDASRDPSIAKFAKAFRAAIKSPKLTQLAPFLEKALPDYEQHLYLLLRHAYAEQIDPILDQLMEKYAETFNQTYDHDGSGSIAVTDEKTFEAIGREALTLIASEVEAADIPSSGFMKNAVAFSLFDQAVLLELDERVKEL